jgi:hypothetical protein
VLVEVLLADAAIRDVGMEESQHLNRFSSADAAVEWWWFETVDDDAEQHLDVDLAVQISSGRSNRKGCSFQQFDPSKCRGQHSG